MLIVIYMRVMKRARADEMRYLRGLCSARAYAFCFAYLIMPRASDDDAATRARGTML